MSELATSQSDVIFHKSKLRETEEMLENLQTDFNDTRKDLAISHHIKTKVQHIIT